MNAWQRYRAWRRRRYMARVRRALAELRTSGLNGGSIRPMAKTPEQYAADSARGHETFHGGMDSFHDREAAKYNAKADALEAAGKVKAAARARKVAERNHAKAAEHQAKLA